MTRDGKENLWRQYYGNEWMDFESDKQIPPETGEALNCYYEHTERISSRIAVESHLTGGRFSMPDIQSIPWPVKEMMKLGTWVSRYQDAVKRVPKSDPKVPDSFAKQAKAERDCNDNWLSILSYANNLDMYFNSVKKGG